MLKTFAGQACLLSETTVVLVQGFGRAEVYSSFGCVPPARLASFCQILGAKFKRASELAVVKAACLGRRETMDVQSVAPVGKKDGSWFPGVISLHRIFDSAQRGRHCSRTGGPSSLLLNRYWDPNINMTLISCQFFHNAVFPGPSESCRKNIWWVFHTWEIKKQRDTQLLLTMVPSWCWCCGYFNLPVTTETFRR